MFLYGPPPPPPNNSISEQGFFANPYGTDIVRDREDCCVNFVGSCSCISLHFAHHIRFASVDGTFRSQYEIFSTRFILKLAFSCFLDLWPSQHKLPTIFSLFLEIRNQSFKNQ
jgi:hypothetical protein